MFYLSFFGDIARVYTWPILKWNLEFLQGRIIQKRCFNPYTILINNECICKSANKCNFISMLNKNKNFPEERYHVWIHGNLVPSIWMKPDIHCRYEHFAPEIWVNAMSFHGQLNFEQVNQMGMILSLKIIHNICTIVSLYQKHPTTICPEFYSTLFKEHPLVYHILFIWRMLCHNASEYIQPFDKSLFCRFDGSEQVE